MSQKGSCQRRFPRETANKSTELLIWISDDPPDVGRGNRRQDRVLMLRGFAGFEPPFDEEFSSDFHREEAVLAKRNHRRVGFDDAWYTDATQYRSRLRVDFM